MIFTRESITGTSTSTPTTVASAAPDSIPHSIKATATASSKKLLAPIRLKAQLYYKEFSGILHLRILSQKSGKSAVPERLLLREYAEYNLQSSFPEI